MTADKRAVPVADIAWRHRTTGAVAYGHPDQLADPGAWERVVIVAADAARPPAASWPGEHEVTVNARDLCGRHAGKTIGLTLNGRLQVGTIESVTQYATGTRVIIRSFPGWVDHSTPVIVPAETEL